MIDLFRFTVAAVLLGPAGVGLLGLMQNLVSVSTVLAASGFAQMLGRVS